MPAFPEEFLPYSNGSSSSVAAPAPEPASAVAEPTAAPASAELAAAAAAAAEPAAAVKEPAAAAAGEPAAAAAAGQPAAAAGQPAAAVTEPAAAAAAGPAWVKDVLRRHQWESPGQHAGRVEFIERVLALMRKEGEINEDNVRLLSGLFYSVRYLGCTYSPELEALLEKYDPELTQQVKEQRQRDAKNLKRKQTNQQHQEQPQQ